MSSLSNKQRELCDKITPQAKIKKIPQLKN